MISREQFDAYNRAVANLSDGAQREIESRIMSWLQTDEGRSASVAECREYAKSVMSGVVQVYDSAAASLAAEWYDKQAADNGARLPAAVTATTYNPESVDETARYQAKKLAKGDPRGFAEYCGELGRNDVLRSLNETIMRNAARDRKKGVRFARVPTGAETCTYCLMLASRGAVYHSRKTAGEFRHFHRRCDCKVVPGFEDDKDAELVEGVRPKELRELWGKFKEIDSAEGLSKAQRNFAKRGVSQGADAEQIIDFARKRVAKSSDVAFENKRVGKKLGSHAGDWGLDPGDSADRKELLSIIKGIIDEADKVDFGVWRGQVGPCLFYVKGDDLVLLDGNARFASVMKGGGNNKRYKSGTTRNPWDQISS